MKTVKGSRYYYYIKDAIFLYPLYLVMFCFHLPYSMLEIYSTYYDKYSVVPAFLVLLIFGLLLFAAFRFALRDTPIAGLGTLAVLIMLFPRSILAVPVYLIAAIAGLGSLMLRALRRKEDADSKILQLPPSFTYIVNVAVLAMTIAIVARGLYYDLKVAHEAEALSNGPYVDIRPSLRAVRPDSLPNIIHIVLDGYSRGDVLKAVYGIDNSPFLDALGERGFRISSRATAPYNQTLFVMASIAALHPVTESMDPSRVTSGDLTVRRVLAHGQQYGTVTDVLTDLGYDLQSTPSTYRPLQWNRTVETTGTTPALQPYRLPGTYVLAYDILNDSPILDELNRHLFSNNFDIVAVNFRNLRDVPNRRFRQLPNRPLFVYQHIIAPHPPFNIRADGSAKRLNGFPSALGDGSHIIHGNNVKRSEYRDGYAEKLRYINQAILAQIDNLMQSLTGPLVIILHGDHGGGLYFEQDDKTATCLMERFSPLLAVYASDDAIANEFTDDFNLVNIYRAIFRVLLDADLPNLPSRHTFISWELDQMTALEPADLERPCTPNERTLTADK